MESEIHVGSSREYATLYDAAENSVDGTLIIVDEGEYFEENQIEIPSGVSVIGLGEVVIKTNYEASNNLDAFLLLESPDTGEDGNQHISNIVFDGEFNGGICALIWCRNNVIFNNCTVKNFTRLGVLYKTINSWYTPDFWASGNIVRNCVFRDCSRRTDYGQGAIQAFGQDGFEVHDNIFYLEDMPAGQNGNMMMLSEVKGFKYYNNASWKSLNEGDAWNMGLEIWDTYGGNEVYNNTFNGGGISIDIAGEYNIKGDYDYSWWVHHNTFQMPSQYVKTNRKNRNVAVEFESENRDAIVSYNKVINFDKAFVIVQPITAGFVVDNITFCYNVCDTIGVSDGMSGMFIQTGCGKTGIVQNIHIYNNVYKGYNSNAMIRLACSATTRNIYIYNNIVEGVKQYDLPDRVFGWLWINNWVPEFASPVEVSNIYVKNNIIFDNEVNNEIFIDNGIEVNNLVQETNLNVNPEYVDSFADQSISGSNFHLKSNSPAIRAGIDVGLRLDLDGKEVDIPPCIGAYEYIKKRTMFVICKNTRRVTRVRPRQMMKR